MSEKKGFLASLFGGSTGGCCNMQITEETGGCCGKAPKKPKKKGGCCDMKIVPAEESGEQCCKQDD